MSGYGEPFNPYRRFRGAMIPNVILRNLKISPTAKLVLARLLQFAGEDGRAWPRIESIAAEVGVGVRQVQRCLKELEDIGLIARQEASGGRHKSNQFVFLRSALWPEETVSYPSETVTDTSSNGDGCVTGGVTYPTPRRDSPEVIREIKESAPPPAREIAIDAEQRIRRVADLAPDQQDYERGVNRAVREMITSANPAATLASMETNIPLWWEAMREGRARMKVLGYVIQDRDYLRRPRQLTVAAKSAKQQLHDAAWEAV